MANEKLTGGSVIVAPGPPLPDASHPATGDVTAHGARMSVVVIDDLTALEKYVPAWEGLAASASEPNVFFEPWMMTPALRYLGAAKTILTALIFAADPSRPGTSLLCGLFPLECGRGYKGLPVKFLRLWRHKHCFLTTP